MFGGTLIENLSFGLILNQKMVQWFNVMNNQLVYLRSMIFCIHEKTYDIHCIDMVVLWFYDYHDFNFTLILLAY